jgi:thiol-disulfide isomerase/thioredoxin
MVVSKKTKNEGIVLLIMILFIFFILVSKQKVDIIFFMNPRCRVSNQSSLVIEGIKEDFGNKIKLREINIKMYLNDPPDTEEVKILREKYRVYGVPTIIINGKEFTKQYTKDNLEEEICNNFIIKPKVCT